MTLTFELAHFSVREESEEALIAERPASRTVFVTPR